MTESSQKRNSIVRDLGDRLIESMSSAKKVDIISSFVQNGGVEYLRNTLIDLCERNVPIRLLTGTYLEITNPHALDNLMKICRDNITIKFYRETYENKGRSFHPKAYIIYGDGDAEIYVGSSNISIFPHSGHFIRET